jgi:hypothetical protein
MQTIEKEEEFRTLDLEADLEGTRDSEALMRQILNELDDLVPENCGDQILAKINNFSSLYNLNSFIRCTPDHKLITLTNMNHEFKFVIEIVDNRRITLSGGYLLEEAPRHLIGVVVD